METGTSIGLSIIAISCLLAGCLFGIVAAAVRPEDRLAKSVAFSWGFAFGPIGLGVVLFLKARASRSMTAPTDPF